MGWAGARPGGRWLSPIIWGSDPRPRGRPKGRLHQASHLFRLGCWRTLAAPASRRLASFACRLLCVQWHVEDPPVGCLLLEAGVRGGPRGISGPHAARGPHIWQSPQRAGSQDHSSALVQRARVGRSEAQAWLRVGLALELVPGSGLRRTLSSGWLSVRL